MANNRMWLANKRTNAKVLIAKYYPSTGWGVFHDDINPRLCKLFRENELEPSQWGDNDWRIEYDEEVETPNGGGGPTL